MRMDNVITTIVGEKLEGLVANYIGTLAAPNGYLYGISEIDTRQVAKFNPIDKSMTRIGSDLGSGRTKWHKGAMTGSGIIYCPPIGSLRGILKMYTNTDTVTELELWGLWESCAAALDGCIYFMPDTARKIMKLDPNNGNTFSSVRDDLGSTLHKYNGTVVGIDGCVYGISCFSKRILKYDPMNDITSFVGEEADELYLCG